MRKTLLLLQFALLISLAGRAQLTPDGSFSATHNVWYAHFSYFGKKYVDKAGCDITLYNTDFTPWKYITVNIPGHNDIATIQHISDKLIDTDTLIEMVVTMKDATIAYTYRTFIINQNSDILYDFGPNSTYNIGCPPQILQDNGHYKLLVGRPNGSSGYSVMAFPMQGYLPCETCIADTTGMDTSLKVPQLPQQQHGTIMVTDPIPNPSNGNVRIGYTLPKGAERGEMVFCNSQGQEVKRITLTQNATTLELNNKGLAEGIYFYHVYSNGKMSAGNKMVVQ